MYPLGIKYSLKKTSKFAYGLTEFKTVLLQTWLARVRASVAALSGIKYSLKKPIKFA